MPAMNQATANNVIDALMGTATFTATTAPLKVRLTTTAPTATAAGTELTGAGYTTGGTTITFASAASGSATNNNGALQWTNSSGGSWSIVGLELWDSAGTPVRKWYGTFTGQPITVANGNIFQIGNGNITVSLG